MDEQMREIDAARVVANEMLEAARKIAREGGDATAAHQLYECQIAHVGRLLRNYSGAPMQNEVACDTNEALDIDDMPPGRLLFKSSTAEILEVKGNAIYCVNAAGEKDWITVAEPPEANWVGREIQVVVTVDFR